LIQKVIITGASGFIGRRLVNRLTGDAEFVSVAVCHTKCEGWPDKAHLHIHQRDLSIPGNWGNLVEPDCVVVNLVYFRSLPAIENILAARRLIDACRRQGVKKLIHCSSAVVAGAVKDDIVTEETLCRPSTEYEKTKWQIEQTLLNPNRGLPEVIVLRPTAVFGSGGQNLVKLVNDLKCRSEGYNYLKSCLYQRRSMNLVSVETVADSIKYFIKSPQTFDHEVFIVSDDEYPENNFIDVERQLMNALGIQSYRIMRINLPRMMLSILLRLTKKSNFNPMRRYSCEKLLRCGFRKKTTFIESLKAYAKDLDHQKMRDHSDQCMF
jgi:nucleoside-diphosphate-sugar epimerase